MVSAVFLTRSVTLNRERTEVELEAAAHRRLDRWSFTRALGLFVALLGFVAAAGSLSDNSFLTHLATGRLILADGVPDVDPYSRIAAGQPWTVQSWLPALTYASLEQLAGLWAVRALHGLLGAAIGLGLWRLTGPAQLLVPRLVLATVPTLIGYHLWSPRPLLFGLLGLVAVLHVVQLGRDGRTLIPIMWLWVNSHGSWPLALALLAAVAAGAWLDDRSRRPDELGLVGWALGGVGLGAIGPVGPDILTFPFQVMARRDALAPVVEWQAPSFRTAGELLFLVVIGLLILAARRQARWRALLPAGGFLILGLSAIRNLSAAAVVIVAMIGPALAEVYGTDDGSAETRLSRLIGRAMAAGLAVAMVAVVVQPAMDLSPYPVEQIDSLEARGLMNDPSVGLVHREAVGNYLTFRYGTEAGVFMDDRFDFHPTAVIADHLDLLEGGDFREILDRRQAEVVLWEADRPLAAWLAEAPEWQVVEADDNWLVACRATGSTVARCRG